VAVALDLPLHHWPSRTAEEGHMSQSRLPAAREPISGAGPSTPPSCTNVFLSNEYRHTIGVRRSNDVGFIAKLFAALGMRNNRIRWRKDTML
jgi:hypothetical protein